MKTKIEDQLQDYIATKVLANGGRPHFFKILHKDGKIPKDELMNILELSFIKGKSDRNIANRYVKKGFNIKYITIFRIRKDLEPFKEEISKLLLETTRPKRFFIPELEHSDYETVQAYIDYSKKWRRKAWKRTIKTALRMWRALGRQDPKNWDSAKALEFIYTLKKVAQSNMVDAARQVAPHFADKLSPHFIPTEPFRGQVGRRFKELFSKEMQQIRYALRKI